MAKAYFLVGLLVAGTDYAGTMGCLAEGVTVPCEIRAWDAGISALYLKPTSSLLNPYLVRGTIISSIPYYNVKSPWDWGFIVEGSYHFNTGNDVNVNWLHFDDRYNDGTSAFFPLQAIPQTRGYALSFKTKLDVVNLEFAQNSNLGSKTNFRVHAGLQYANGNIERSSQASEQINNSPPTLFETSTLDAKYRGVGPRLGGDISRQLPHNFAVFAKGAMALLIGESRTKLSGDNRSGPRITPFNDYMSQTNLVPEFEAKLGASYQFNAKMGQFSVLAGWMFQHYFNMFLSLPGEDFNTIENSASHELSLNGPFIQGKWVSAT
ncbi:Lpg1974 family pore-forming outer membrane protein [Legionella hackeliae]|uniref:Putative Major outer membrane protein n=1 Tax=Legionella hackeliae TaxID=449 RepID=A0A0A8UN99_LEGHA|nr:Lpg1974 family pore-forming outer membrane protein [Legionella hackeliae]KTD08779.1 outer membrane protein [Legionella hackeliae]CEK10208.1 putative Major outer membrane protein [Legionella hackeliae]STX46934.1 outer membrane protein [Legionella hackeliae]